MITPKELPNRNSISNIRSIQFIDEIFYRYINNIDDANKEFNISNSNSYYSILKECFDYVNLYCKEYGWRFELSSKNPPDMVADNRDLMYYIKFIPLEE